MPLNDYPTAKPTYDFYDTVTAGRTVVANGRLVSVHHASRQTARSPHGSVTWHWHAPDPIASYLVENSVGNYRSRAARSDGIISTGAGQAIPAAPAAEEPQGHAQAGGHHRVRAPVHGAVPVQHRRDLVGTPAASFDEEMQAMIAFSGGSIDTDTLYHENMHQWWGDNVSEDGYQMTFFKEGMATAGRDPVRRAPGAERGGRPVDRRRPGRVPEADRQRLRSDLRRTAQLLDGRAVKPAAVQPLLRPANLPATRHRIRRPAPDPRARPLHDGAGARSSAHYGGVEHHRAAARGRLPPVAAGRPAPARRG